jgi:hypothetical protein
MKYLLCIGLSFVLTTAMIFAHGNLAAWATTGSNSTTAETTSDIESVPHFLFAECGVTSAEGNSTLPGMNLTESLLSVIFDNNSNSYVFGDVTFKMPFTNRSATLHNGPGYDMHITEIGNTEGFNLTIFSSGKNNSRNYLPEVTGSKNTCNQDINVASVDLGFMGVPSGESVQALQLNNLGKPGCCVGSDIAGINYSAIASQTAPVSGLNPLSRPLAILNPDEWVISLMMPMPSRQ